MRSSFVLPFVLLLAGLPAGCSSDPAATAVASDRQATLEGQVNFRDLGGYRTADGRSVARGEVYRSGELAHLTDDDLATLERLGVRTVVSFLTPNEVRAGGADRLPEGVEEIALPIDAKLGLGDLVDELIVARQTGDFREVPPELNPEIHRALVREAGEPYAALLRAIADPERRPLVFHCSHGVHRTGTAAALLLTALGVPWETVRADYLVSNERRADATERELAELREQAAQTLDVPVDEVDTTNMEAFYVLQPTYIDAAREEAEREHGSLEAYLREGVGLGPDELAALRAELLVE